MEKIDKIKYLMDYLSDLNDIKISKYYVDIILDIYEYEESISFGVTFYILKKLDVGVFADLEESKDFQFVLASGKFYLLKDLKNNYMQEEKNMLDKIINTKEETNKKRRI